MFGRNSVSGNGHGLTFDMGKRALVFGNNIDPVQTATCSFAFGSNNVGAGTSYSMAFGRVDSGDSYIGTGGNGALAHGYAGQGYAYIYAGGYGSHAHGYVYYYNYSAGIKANGGGSHASGYAYDGYIYADGTGSFAHGFAYGGKQIRASGEGSVAMGSALNAHIQATAQNSFQFGEGSNTVANSLQVGSTVHIKPNTMWIKEKASETNATATWGKLWVKNTVPCELWFTNDAGTAKQVALV
jgi:hypothetical protein